MTPKSTIKENFMIFTINFVIIYTFIQYLLKDSMILGNKYISLIDDFIILGLFIITLLEIAINKKLIKCKYNKVFLLLTVIICVSGVLNRISFKVFILGIKGYLLYILFFYVIMLFVENKRQIKMIINALIFCSIIQILFTVPQFLSGVLNSVSNDDMVYGTFGKSGANIMSYSLFFIFFYLTTYLLLMPNKRIIIYSIITGFNFILGFGMTAIGMFPFIFTFINRKIFKYKNTFKRLVIAICIFILIFGMFRIVNNPDNRNQRQGIYSVFNYKFLYKHFTQSEMNVYSGSARNLWYPITYDRLNEYAVSPSIGMGPGMYASFTAFNLMPLTNLSIYNIFHQTELGLDPGVDSQIIPIWGELGNIGLLVFFSIFVMIYLNLKNIINKCSTIDTKILALTGLAGTIFMFFGFYIGHFWEIQTICLTFFTFLALADRSYDLERFIDNTVID